MIKNSLLVKTSLQHVLTPQQVQYLKILQLPITSLEHTIKQEVEENPFLEEFNDLIDEDGLEQELDINAPAPDQLVPLDSVYESEDINSSENFDNKVGEYSDFDALSYSEGQDYSVTEGLNYLEENDYYTEPLDDSDFTPGVLTDVEKDYEDFPISSEISLYDLLVEQINVLDLSTEDRLIAIYIIGNIDDDGYLRRDSVDILKEVNSIISNHNREIQIREFQAKEHLLKDKHSNPAKKYELNSQSIEVLLEAVDNNLDIFVDTAGIRNKIDESYKIFKQISSEDIDRIVKIVQSLDPPGIAARNIQECLIAQLKAKSKLNEGEAIALMILTDCFDEFSKKHFLHIQKKLEITEEQLKDAFDEIKKLNPKPGNADNISQHNTIIPDFIVQYDDKINDFTINLNDSNIPLLKVSQTYEKILAEAKRSKEYNKDTRDWMKERYENAKFFIQALHQRNISMLMVMTAIVHRQREFFFNDVKKIKPMIYKDVSNDTSLDISTVCRIVNDKYVQTSTGNYELKFFFSESLLSVDGEEIATTVIKDRLKYIISTEPKNKPYSDEQLVALLKKEGYNVARRTLAKYRETLKIPIARLRKEL